MLIQNKSLTVRISDKLKHEFQKYCNENGFSCSKRIKLLIEKDIKKKIDLKK